jgi:hypothetical protein
MSWMSENVGASASHNPKGLHSLYRDKFTLNVWHLQAEGQYYSNAIANNTGNKMERTISAMADRCRFTHAWPLHQNIHPLVRNLNHPKTETQQKAETSGLKYNMTTWLWHKGLARCCLLLTDLLLVTCWRNAQNVRLKTLLAHCTAKLGGNASLSFTKQRMVTALCQAVADFNAWSTDATDKMHKKIDCAIYRHFLALSQVWGTQTKRW